MDNVQQVCHFNNTPSSQTFRIYLLKMSAAFARRHKNLGIDIFYSFIKNMDKVENFDNPYYVQMQYTKKRLNFF
jgi:hypothetical protein